MEKFKNLPVIGIDEVGRGSWAGPLVVGAVYLTKPIDGLADSKLLSINKRISIYNQLKKTVAFGLGWVSASEIDDIGLSLSLKLATAKALEDLNIDLTAPIIIDGLVNFLPEINDVKLVPKADQKIPAVSAASIIAKVARDYRMQELSVEFPQYGFDKNVGYGTAMHKLAINKYGFCGLHRRTFKIP
jgi:ribonuclease HII